jgi:hypothetical protein
MRVFLLIIGLLLAQPSFAQSEKVDLMEKLALAAQLEQIRPVENQIKSAVGRYVELKLTDASPENRAKAAAALMEIINVKALQQISIDTYAEVYSQAELEAMVEYYTKPEAKTAAAKQDQIAARIGPEIIRMLDQALIQARTAAQNAPKVQGKP